MKRSLSICFLLYSLSAFTQTKINSSTGFAHTISFNDGWFFIKGTISNAGQVSFDDSKWRKLDLPHDWSIEDLPNQIPDSIIGPFDKGSTGGTFTGFTNGGMGWYRKRFVTEKAVQNKQVTMYFDGVYMNSDVWLNGHRMSNHPHGYTPFYHDLTFNSPFPVQVKLQE